MRDRLRTENGRGFSIVEVVIAIGVVTVIVVSVAGLVIPIQESIREGHLTAYANRYLPTVEEKLNTPGDDRLATALQSDTAFLLVYQVRVDPDFSFEKDPTFGDLHPALEGGVTAGYRLAPVARRSWNSVELKSWDTDVDAIEGPAFLVRVQPEKSDRLQPENLTEVTAPEVSVLNCIWHELPLGLSQAQWEPILNQRSILRIPVVLRP